MRKLAIAAGLVITASLSGCYQPRKWNPGIATPSATTLHYQREAAKTNPAGVGTNIAAGLGLAVAGARPDGAPSSGRSGQPAADPAAPVRAVEAPSAFRAEIDEEAAVHACVLAAKGEGRRAHPHALLDRIASVDPVGDGLMVRGTPRLRRRNDAAEDVRPFRCRVDAQAVRMVAIDAPETAAAR